VAVVARTFARRNGAPAKPAASGPPTIETVRVVSQPVIVMSMGELGAQRICDHPRVSVRQIDPRDRGSRVRAGEQIALLEAPELAAQRSGAVGPGAEALLGPSARRRIRTRARWTSSNRRRHAKVAATIRRRAEA
jgi:hypothetical protein